MKYVVFARPIWKSQDELLCFIMEPVICPAHITHSCLKVEGAVAVSAGFFSIALVEGESDGYCKTESYFEVEVRKQGSTSLNLNPHFLDRAILRRVLCGSDLNLHEYKLELEFFGRAYPNAPMKEINLLKPKGDNGNA